MKENISGKKFKYKITIKTEYENRISKSPFEILTMIGDEKEALYEELTEFDQDFDFLLTGQE